MTLANEGLMAAVTANPDDDLPRLVYADWLDENGEPERAEFIRVQCEVEHLHDGDPRKAALTERSVELGRAHGRQWADQDLGPGVRKYRLRRGLIEDVSASAGRFLRDGDRWAATVPFRTLRLTDAADLVDDLAASKAADRAGCLIRLILDRCDLGDDHLLTLFADHPRPNLTILSVAGNHFTGAGLAAVFGLQTLSAVRTVDANGCEFLHRGLAAVAATPAFAGVTDLNVSGTNLDEAPAALAGGPGVRGLRRLSAAYNGLNPQTATAFARAADFPSLLALLLQGNWIGDGGAIALAEAAGLANLRLLNVSKNEIGGAGALALAGSYCLRELEEVLLYDNDIGDVGEDEVVDRWLAIDYIAAKQAWAGWDSNANMFGYYFRMLRPTDAAPR